MSGTGPSRERSMAMALMDDAPPPCRCPHLEAEGGWPACAAAEGGPGCRRMAAGLHSLQLWCLGGPHRWAACCHFQARQERQEQGDGPRR